MFQTTASNMEEKDFTELTNAFKETIKNAEGLITKEDNEEWSMDTVYTPNWSCIWNKPKNVGKKCYIVGKDSMFAFVEFIKEDEDDKANEDFLARVYRLEDLNTTQYKAVKEAA